MPDQIESYKRGIDVLFHWCLRIEDSFDKGDIVNKTQYNKIKALENKYREECGKLIAKSNASFNARSRSM